ncbi:hypothetical protein AM493_08865 [Flavobacterium akiainvivens]|uniref:MPN domain-containing protein n=1 Tax=Flavobacterium akiainvivens TaxID=1202724 RepID=A0A0N0RQM9_9FLAO|nr:JAB domain-containing protein [Flavobacterium akiainvivens]KOS06130.1 hypothetical protein AM493_08865 [Flavobacterium akiainvivens]SFQ67727.1 RadC-like JAB domain-containing protein [Flavobacterium akiainvivens]
MSLTQDFSKVAEIQLTYKGNYMPSEKPVIRTSRDAYNLFSETWDSNTIELQEHFRIMVLDRDNSVLGVSTISTGGITACIVDTKLVFVTALLAKASGIIIAHNHPSGNKRFSSVDKKLTRDLATAGKVLDIPVLDHLLVTKEGWLSMADIGEMPNILVMPQETIVPF